MAPITLHQVAPWNRALRNTYRDRFAEVEGRYFKVSADGLQASWDVDEIDAEGNWIDLVATSLRLAAAPAAIEAHLAEHPARLTDAEREQRLDDFLATSAS